jgi:hypothetical protein
MRAFSCIKSGMWIAGVLAVLLAARLAEAADSLPSTSSDFRRGINNYTYLLNDAATLTKSDDATALLSHQTYAPSIPAAMARLKATGLDFLRLHLDIRPLLGSSSASQARQLARVSDVLQTAASQGLCVILVVQTHQFSDEPAANAILSAASENLHHPLRDAIYSIAAAIDKIHSCIGFELFAEPPFCGNMPDPWPRLQQELYQGLRLRGFRRAIILTGSCYSNLNEFLETNPEARDDENVLYTFHFYEPVAFTHQGATFSAHFLRYISGLSYPYDARNSASVRESALRQLDQDSTIGLDQKALTREQLIGALDAFDAARPDRAWIRARLELAAVYYKRFGIGPDRILIGEFGALLSNSTDRNNSAMSRANWLRDVRETAEQLGFRWALWNDVGNFGLFEKPDETCPVPEIAAALGLNTECR